MDEQPIRDPYRPEHFPIVIVISGPSGVGKDSVLQELQARGYPFHFVVTATSRPPRSQEIHGVDYVFVSEAEFEAMIREDALLEHALVYGQYKGVPKQQVRDALASGKDVVMRLDVQGAATVKCLLPEAVLIYLSAASEEELVARLRARASDTEAQIQRRIQTAQEELGCLGAFDYVVVNSEGALDQAVDTILAIIRSEHCRVHPRIVRL
ncbi:MAG: guanylate kinase [Anaerolineae bacterium]|jgi:guanylate kinase|nr:guanylate kinase [Anaerolineae bacterium]